MERGIVTLEMVTIDTIESRHNKRVMSSVRTLNKKEN